MSALPMHSQGVADCLLDANLAAEKVGLLLAAIDYYHSEVYPRLRRAKTLPPNKNSVLGQALETLKALAAGANVTGDNLSPQELVNQLQAELSKQRDLEARRRRGAALIAEDVDWTPHRERRR